MIKIITVGVLLAMALTTAACRTPESKIPDTVILEQKDSSDALTDETSPITGIWNHVSGISCGVYGFRYMLWTHVGWHLYPGSFRQDQQYRGDPGWRIQNPG